MINFSNLELRVKEKYSFVGIEREGNRLVFHLPKGFPSNDISLNTFDKKRDLFFRFYKVFKVFENICAENNETKNKISDRDGVAKENEGAEITAKPEEEETIVYSKVDFLDSILDVYDELKILALVSRLGRSEAIDYSQLHRYLHRGVFLPNNAIYIDSMTLPRLEVRYDETDIAAMYSYILTEVKQQLNEPLSPEIIALSERFKQKYIGFDGSLFSGEYYQQIMDLLKDALELIDSRTPLKDTDYWDFYDAIETFLFGEINWNKEGEIWGVNNFHSVWESMCLTYLVKTTDSRDILHLDSKFIASQFSKLGEKNAQIFEFNGKQLIPDAVVVNQDVFAQSLSHKQHPVIDVKKLRANNWDDYGFRTLFEYDLDDDNTFMLSIAYRNQKNNEIQTFFIYNKINMEKELYSYWDWEEAPFPLEKKIQLMQEYNHIYYVAYVNQLFHEQDFIEYFLNTGCAIPVSFFRNLYEKSRRDVSRTLKKIYEGFRHFFMEVFPIAIIYKVIDIKYFNFDDFIKVLNVEEIKRRSIRKQFVYEYQIQKHLEKLRKPEKPNKLFTEWEIKSEFWLPVYSPKPDDDTFSPGPEYLDGYIKLVGVNIIKVIDKYVEDYTTG